MESANPSSSAPPYSGEGAGAGGKFRKPPISRKRPSTPYARPSLTSGNNKSDECENGGGGWLSKLVVNPARRLIVGGATRILPSFFSKSDSSSADDYEDDPLGDRDDQDIDATENAQGDAKHTVELGVSRWGGAAGLSNEMDKLKGSSEHNIVQQDESKNSLGDHGLAKIENMLKGKQFSRDERNRLMEILNSRLVDVSNAEEEKKTPAVIFHGKAKEDVVDHTIGKQYNVERAVLETPMPRSQSNMQDEVGASPIDIARAYMGTRISEKLGFSTYSIKSKDEREHQNNDLIPSKPHILTPSSKSSACWPGAMVQDQRGYLTPQIQRTRYGLHNFPRTPYSRTIYSSTKPKLQLNQLQGDSKPSNVSLTTFQQSRTPNYGQMKSSSGVMDGGYGSVGPIRRVRNKFPLEPQSEGPSASRSFVPIFQKNPEASGTSGTKNIPRLDRHEHKGEATPGGPSSETVRKIMEQLDRHKPTPKEKAEELKLATEWKRSSSENTNLMPTESSILGTLTEHYSSDNASSVKKVDSGVSFKGMEEPMKTSLVATKASGSVGDAGAGPSFGFKNTSGADEVLVATKASGSVGDASAGPSFGFKNTSGADEKSTVTNIKEKEKSQPWSFDNQINGQDLSKKRPSQPILKPISFKRPDPQQVISSDNSRGFTFPFSATASSASEPPTPSIMPSFSVTGVPQAKESPVIPAYNFGTKKSGERLVFSFPSTSTGPIDDGESDLKFKFGSDKKRVSFGLIGTDAIAIN